MARMKTTQPRKKQDLKLVLSPVKLRLAPPPQRSARMTQDRRTRRQSTRRAKTAAALRD